jgi:alpha-glucosidase
VVLAQTEPYIILINKILNEIIKSSFMKYFLFFFFLYLSFQTGYSQNQVLISPDGKNLVEIFTEGSLSYSVKHSGEIILFRSPLLMKVGDENWGNNSKVLGVKTESVSDKVIYTVPRKYKTALDQYNKLTLTYKNFRVEFRAYNDGIAYRFSGREDQVKKVYQETVCYNFPENYQAYTLLTDKLQNWFEENYTVNNIEELPNDSFSITPLMVCAGKCKLLLTEANLFNYPGMYLQPAGKSFNGLFANFPLNEELLENGNKLYVAGRENFLVETTVRRSFPWRVMGIFEKDPDILISDLPYLLSDEKAPGADFSWVKPGKVLWDWWNDRNIYNVSFASGINTETYKYLIDYAASHEIEYILIDEGWSARDDLLELNPEVDIPAVCKHAQSKGVGVILWAKWINVDRQMEKAFDIFGKWGVKGVKIDFMDRNDARMVNFLYRVAQKSAEHHLLVDFHGVYPCLGITRRYPNVMTYEGVLGLEYNKWSARATVSHDLIIPYLRMWAGPMDYTPGAMLNAQPETFHASHKEPMSQGTRSHQVAMYIIYESPLQMLSDSPTKYEENTRSFDFIKRIPATWDETIPIDGRIGEYLVVARRSGETWYVGGLNGDKPRELEIKLPPISGNPKTLEIHADGINAFKEGKDFMIYNATAEKEGTITIKMASGGGFAAIIK